VSTTGGTEKETPVTVEFDDKPPVIKLDDKVPNATAESSVKLDGLVEKGTSLSINGKAVQLEGISFSADFPLKDGANHFRLEARDFAGNLSVLEHQVLYDHEPPKLIGRSVKPENVKGGEDFTITISASDESGLVKTAQVEFQVGDETRKETLVLAGNGKDYSSKFGAPANGGGKITLKKVTLSDYLGNKKEYDLGR
jgi:hypothetical protein